MTESFFRIVSAAVAPETVFLRFCVPLFAARVGMVCHGAVECLCMAIRRVNNIFSHTKKASGRCPMETEDNLDKILSSVSNPTGRQILGFPFTKGRLSFCQLIGRSVGQTYNKSQQGRSTQGDHTCMGNEPEGDSSTRKLQASPIESTRAGKT